MASEKKTAQKVPTLVKELAFSNGETAKILTEDGKYYFCEGRKFRKANPNIVGVNVSKASEPIETSDKTED